MAGFAERSHWTAGDAALAGALRIEEAVCVVIVIRPGGCRDLHLRHHGAHAHGLSERRNQAVTQSESAQARCIGRMPFRPGRSKAIRFGHLLRPLRRQHRRNGLISFFLQGGDNVLAEFDIDLFAVETGPRPSLRREFLFFPRIRFRCFHLRENPAYNGEVSRPHLRVREGLLEDLERRPVKGPYVPLVVFVERIIST